MEALQRRRWRSRALAQPCARRSRCAGRGRALARPCTGEAITLARHWNRRREAARVRRGEGGVCAASALRLRCVCTCGACVHTAELRGVDGELGGLRLARGTAGDEGAAERLGAREDLRQRRLQCVHVFWRARRGGGAELLQQRQGEEGRQLVAERVVAALRQLEAQQRGARRVELTRVCRASAVPIRAAWPTTASGQLRKVTPHEGGHTIPVLGGVVNVHCLRGRRGHGAAYQSAAKCFQRRVSVVKPRSADFFFFFIEIAEPCPAGAPFDSIDRYTRVSDRPPGGNCARSPFCGRLASSGRRQYGRVFLWLVYGL